MKLSISVKMLKEDVQDEKYIEIAEILSKISKKIMSGEILLLIGDTETIMDTNGNSMGTLIVGEL